MTFSGFLSDAGGEPTRRPLHGHLPKLYGVRLKLNRAEAHAEALNREVDAWLGRHPYATFGEYEPGPPEKYLFKVRFFEFIPAEWGVVLGDFVHDARSALEHLAYQVVLAGNGGMDARSQFPITDDPWKWRKVVRKLNGASHRRGMLALGLTLLLFIIALLLVIFTATGLLTSGEAKDLAASVLSPVVAVTGTALGFYFGAHRQNGE
jgi:hypothetical protein